MDSEKHPVLDEQRSPDWLASSQTVPAALAPGRIIGRGREQAMLGDHLARVRSGSGSLVLLNGEAGIGKTALAAALAKTASSDQFLVATGRCYDLIDTPPYGPWLEILTELSASSGEGLAPTLSFEPDAALSADGERAAAYSRIIENLTAIANPTSNSMPTGLLLILDDLQWADSASLELLRLLARRLSRLPILVIAAYRGEELSSGDYLYEVLPLLIRESPAARIDLKGLDVADLREMVGDSYQLEESDRERLVQYLIGRSDGNPFFASELLRTLEEEGRLLIAGADSGCQLGRLDDLSVPDLLMQVIERRLARLSDEAQRALAVAAVIGLQVPLDLWAAVLDRDELSLLPIIEQAIAARMLDANSSGLGVSFTHALYRQALYSRTLPPRRRRWHGIIADRLIDSGNETTSVIAYHLERAGDPRAADWLIRAGEHAQRSYAFITASDLFEAALEAIELRGGPAGERAILRYRIARMRRYANPSEAIAYLDDALPLAEEVGDQLLRGYIIGSRGQIHCSSGAIRQGIAEIEQGLALLDDLGSVEIERLPDLQARLGEPAGAHDFRGALTSWYSLTGRYDAAAATGRIVIERASGPALRGGGTSAQANAWNGRGLVEAALGEPTAARAAFEEAIAAYQSAGHWYQVGNALMLELTEVVLPYQTDDLAGRAELADAARIAWTRASGALDELPVRLAYLPLLLLEGAWEEAVQLAELLLRPSGRPAWRAFATTALANLHHFRGDDAMAERLILAELPAGPETAPGNAILSDALPLIRLASEIALAKGDEATAIRWLVLHDSWLDWSGNLRDRPAAKLAWAAFHLRCGRLAEADRQAQQALQLAESPRRPLLLLEGRRLLGEVQLAARRWTSALAEFELALAGANACVARFERGRILLGMAEVYRGMDAFADAVTRAGEALTVFEQLDARPYRARAERLLSEIETRPGSRRSGVRRSYPAGLSRREVEVLRLVTEGLTDAQVADRLFLSPRTVSQHLRTIYRKLGVSSRTAAARFATEHNLV